MPFLFCNTAWMKFYKGVHQDRPDRGGLWIEEHGTGSEIYNFDHSEGIVRGFVMVKGSIELRRLGGKGRAMSVDGVTVIWVAPSPSFGSVIVGTYMDATVLKYMERDPRFRDRDYNIIAQPENARLIPESERTFKIPRGRGGMGQANHWYAESQPTTFFDSVLNYLQTVKY